MANSLLADIISTENIAEQKEQEAYAKARDIIASAKKEAMALIEEKEREADAEAEAVLKSYGKKASEDIENFRSKIQEECRNITEQAGKKIEQAADFIVGRIVTQIDR